jgi:hypothetical protein
VRDSYIEVLRSVGMVPRIQGIYALQIAQLDMRQHLHSLVLPAQPAAKTLSNFFPSKVIRCNVGQVRSDCRRTHRTAQL